MLLSTKGVRDKQGAAGKTKRLRLDSRGGPTSLHVLFLRRGFSGTCTCSTCDTLFCVLAEGGAERRVTGVTSDLVERLSLKFLDTENQTTGAQQGASNTAQLHRKHKILLSKPKKHKILLDFILNKIELNMPSKN